MATQRIVSLVPSQTELLYNLGLDKEVVGITKFCIHPNNWFATKVKIGGTKTVNISKVAELQPTLIIANKEENTKEEIEQLEKIAPVYISDIVTLTDAIEMIHSIGNLTKTIANATTIANNILQEFNNLQQYCTTHRLQKNTVCYLIWQKPYMCVATNTFINTMIDLCELKNVFENEERYPEKTIEQIIAANPNIVMLSSEPYPFKQKHIAELQQHLPNAKIILVDGEMFSWYGSRLIQAPHYFISLLEVL